MEPEATKTCSMCKETKPLSEFPSDKGRSDGKRANCYICKRERDRKSGARKASRKMELTLQEQLERDARREALRALVHNHPREYRQLVERHLEQVNAPKKWRSVS